MEKSIVKVTEKKIVGVTVRTNNKNELDPSTSKIGPIVQHYCETNIPATIPNRVNTTYPGINICAYYDYVGDFENDFTYFIGEEVTEFSDNTPNNLTKAVIASQTYVKFTTEPGPMPHVIIDAWRKIWQMSEAELGGVRSYISDFEIFDERAMDRNNTVIDIYVGIKN